MGDRGVTKLLRAAARSNPTPLDDRRVRDAVSAVRDWGDVPMAAEAHGIAPLLHSRVQALGLDVPVHARQQVFGLTARHREVNRACFLALAEILEAFEIGGIRVVVLKGAALAHLLYSLPSLRPLSDIDLLVDAGDARRAQSTLAALGFSAPLVPTSRRLASHHHLPPAMKLVDGQFVHVEIHTDALSRDAPGSLPLRAVYDRGQPFSTGSATTAARALGHADMLHHLVRHAAERASLLRLIWVADIVGYATRFRDAIPWDEVRVRTPFVLNALSLLHLVTPLPECLRMHVSPCEETMEGIGVSCRPLSEAIRPGRRIGEIARDVFVPSEWWVRLYYGADRRSLTRHRLITHPLEVGRWLARRAVAYTRWWARGAPSESQN